MGLIVIFFAPTINLSQCTVVQFCITVATTDTFSAHSDSALLLGVAVLEINPNAGFELIELCVRRAWSGAPPGNTIKRKNPEGTGPPTAYDWAKLKEKVSLTI